MNKFQHFMIFKQNRPIVYEIVKLFHPELSDLELPSLKIFTKYSWVTIDGRGVSIGIEFNPGFSGIGWKMKDFVEAFNKRSFRAWRFADDKKFKTHPHEEDISHIVKKHNIPKPTPTEMMKYYYSD